MGLSPNTDGRVIMAVADLNNDKSDDLVTVNKEGTTITVYYFDAKTLTYSLNAEFALPNGYSAESVIVAKKPQALQSLLVTANSNGITQNISKMLMY